MTAWRAWQQTAREAYHLAETSDFLCEATPGAGKTRFALGIMRDWLTTQTVRRLVVVCPTAHLRRQWAEAAARQGLALDPDPRPGDGREGPDFQGAIYTYQQLAVAPDRYAALTQHIPTGVVFDEIHHAGDGLTWGEALRRACDSARRRLALSGTPFRSDEHRIPFVRYSPDGLSLPDVRYDYAAALRDGVCRPLYCPAYGGVVSWQRAHGVIRTVSFQDALAASARRDRLRAAVLSLDWLDGVLAAAHRRLLSVRAHDPTAGGLVVAGSQEHARTIAARLAALAGAPPTLAISDDPAASRALRAFAAADTAWLVAVNMVSEGVDLPRLRVGVYATTITTELYFRQVAGRLVRRRPEDGPDTCAWLYLPSDPILLTYARDLDAARRRVAQELAAATPVPMGHATARSRASFTPLGGLAWSQETVVPAGVTGGPALTLPTSAPPVFEQRDRLRARHHRLVGAVARRWGLPHRLVHTELTRRTGSRLEEAALEQLAQRLALLDQWLKTGFL